MKNISIICFFIVAFASGCSDKYRSVYEAAPDPALRFSKELVTVRERDYTNINATDNGKLTLYCDNASHQLNIQFSGIPSALHFLYRGDEIHNNAPVVTMDSVCLFVAADTVGVFSIDVFLADQLGKTTQKQLIVNSIANKAATATFFSVQTEQGGYQNWPYVFDASISQDPDGKIMAYHYSVNGQWMVSAVPVMNWIFHAKGIHDVGLYVTDDLGKNSETVHRQITIQ